jgi:hypothetical protein
MYEKFLGLSTLFFLLKIEGIAGIAQLTWATGWANVLNSQQGAAQPPIKWALGVLSLWSKVARG